MCGKAEKLRQQARVFFLGQTSVLFLSAILYKRGEISYNSSVR